MAVVLLVRHLGAGVRHTDATSEASVSTTNPLNKDSEMKALFNRFVREESGQDLIEYGLLIGIITAGAIAAVTAIGPKVQKYYEDLESNLP